MTDLDNYYQCEECFGRSFVFSPDTEHWKCYFCGASLSMDIVDQYIFRPTPFEDPNLFISGEKEGYFIMQEGLEEDEDE